MNDEPEIPFEALEPETPYIAPRYCPEPMHIGSLMAQTLNSAVLVGLSEPNASKHPYDGLCRQCGGGLDVKWTQIDRCTGWFPVNIHEECKDAYYRTIGVAAQQAEQWQKICPPDFRAPWDAQKGNDALRRRVLSFDPLAKKGMLIHGKSGSCKTRVVWLLARQLLEQGYSVTFVAAIDLPDEPMREMVHAPILIIDDLGNDKMQSAKEAVMLKVLRQRTEWHRPTIVTTQFVGESLTARFSEANTAKAVIRRLREFCDDVIA
jgi:DNA replication protein DnaC